MAHLLPIEGNYSELHQVIMNLCNNAKDAMPSGGILQIEAKGENNRISTTISDTGVGMDESTVKRVFDPFFTTKAPEEGTGLGLYTSYAIIQNHGGTVYVQSQAGLGTSFKMTFPMPQKVSQSKPPAPKRIVFGEGQKVLIVDDDRSVRKPTQSLLTSIGYDTSTAESGLKALEIYKELEPDVVLMDINMPGMDGLTTIKHLKEIDPQAKVVIVSGYEEKGTHGIDDETRAMIKAYITKPFDTSELSQLLAALTKD